MYYYQLYIVCLHNYSSVLWDFSSQAVNGFYTAWIKSIKRLLRLPLRTHNELVPGICADISAEA